MNAVIYLLVLAISRLYGVSIPSKHFVTKDFIGASHILNEINDPAGLLEKYIRSLVDRVKSLEDVVASGDDFHTDAVLFSLLDAPMYILKVEKSILNVTGHGSGHSFSFQDYEMLLRAVMDQTGPEIHPRFLNSSLLSELSHTYMKNFEIVYVPDIFDSTTFDRVCSFSIHSFLLRSCR
jgi:hypothetical protein